MVFILKILYGKIPFSRIRVSKNIDLLFLDYVSENKPLPDLVYELIYDIDKKELEDVSNSFFVFKDLVTHKKSSYKNFSLELITLIGLVLDKQEKYYFSTKYVSQEMLCKWLPVIINYSNSNLILEDNVDILAIDLEYSKNNIYSLRQGKIIEVIKDWDKDIILYEQEKNQMSLF